jgi:hypothetical protein
MLVIKNYKELERYNLFADWNVKTVTETELYYVIYIDNTFGEQKAFVLYRTEVETDVYELSFYTFLHPSPTIEKKTINKCDISDKIIFTMHLIHFLK